MILLFAGFFSTNDEYLPLQRELGSDVRIFDYTGLTSTPLKDLGEKICERVQKPTIALGYSMGGRVLLQALKHSSKNFEAACFVSTNPGLKFEADRKQRLASDQEWAKKIRTSPWDELVREWNAQPVFATTGPEPVRLEADFDREILAETLLNWSLGAQEDHRSLIENLSIPNLWMTGAQDPKFCGFLKDLNIGKKTQTRVINEAGHRVHLDQPAALARTFSAWLKQSR